MSNQVAPAASESEIFGLSQTHHAEIAALFKDLQMLAPMDKNGSMSGRCATETDQMEQFLGENFGFKNTFGEYIVDGVKSFKLNTPLDQMSKDNVIYFPKKTPGAFAMSINEIIQWQQSYKVYADSSVEGMSAEFLAAALEGKSNDGPEAFLMKFVVRISTCPILMEFDAKVIPRNVGDDWSHRIKLVSVTGIDFAGRKHDFGDILHYIPNWNTVFDIDSALRLPRVFNGRDFSPTHATKTELSEKRVLDSLIRMVRIRLHACDEEAVQIVVETGIGLGVFAGNHIGIDGIVRTLSAQALQTVLEQDGSSYKHIRAVVLALPIFARSSGRRRGYDTYDDFVHVFRKSPYKGPIPVLIADQDMHRLTVAIARHNYTVSELNPADSHGVFGEYWQNRGPAVEEKLALTTVGLLVQHHLINPEVLNQRNYKLVKTSEASALKWQPYEYTDGSSYPESNGGCCTVL